MRKVNLESASMSPTTEDQIDRICDLFEADLKAGLRPDLSAILRQVPADLQQHLLYELILVGLEYAGTSARRDDPTDTTNDETRSRRLEHTEQATTHATQLSHTEQFVCGPSVQPGLSAPPVVIGGYELLNELGRGGMGIVYRARQISVDRLVALKIIQGRRFETTDDARRAVFLERFRTEAKAASRLAHENIATVFEIGQFGDYPYYTMRLVEGTSLDKLVQAGPLPADRAVQYLLPIAHTIDRLHSNGVVHRDLKPSNILIEEATDTPIVTDFGLAKLIDAQHQVTLSDEGFGSPPYMAPEQVLHATSVTSAADTYSLGATLYHLLTGRPPFQADTIAEIARQIVFCDPIPPRQLNSSIPRDLETICLKCLEKDEHRRYTSTGGLANDLGLFLEHRPIVARPVGSMGRIGRWCRRNPTWVTLVVSFAVVVAVMTVTSSFMYFRQRLATAVAERALADNRLSASSEFLNKSHFTEGRNPHESLPWLIGCLKLDTGTSRELATRQRIYSVLFHGPDFDHIYCHDGPISCGAFNSTGDCVLTSSLDGTARLWSTKTGNCLHAFRHSAPVRQAVFSHRGDLLATAADDGIGQIWTVDSGQKIGSPLAHPGHVRFAMFSANDEFLVTASSDERVRVWSAHTGSLQRSVAVGEVGSAVSCLALSPQRSRAVSSCGNSRARVWELETGDFRSFELGHSDVVTSANFSPDSAAIATCGVDGKTKIWDSDSGRLLFECAHSIAVKNVCFTADSKRVVTATNEAAHIWSLESKQVGAVRIVHEGLKTVAVDGASGTVLTVGDDRKACVWSLQDGKSLGDAFFHADDLNGAQFSNDGKSLLTFSVDGTARTWNRNNCLRKCRLAEIPNVLTVNATPDRQWILAWDEAGVGNVFRASAPDSNFALFKHDEAITAACVSPDGQRIAAADTNGNLIVCNRLTGQTLTQPLPHRNVVRSIEFAPDKSVIATSDDHGNVTLCDVDAAEILNSFSLPSGVIKLAFSASGSLLLAADSKAVRLIQPDSKNPSDTRSIELGGSVRGARFSQDGHTLVIYGIANRVLLWDIVGGSLKPLRTGSPVTDVCFSDNSSRLLTVAQNGTAQIWRVLDGVPIGKAMVHAAPLTLGAFSPNGQMVALCADDHSARIWDTENGQPVTICLNHNDRIMHVQFVAPQRLLTVTEHGDIHVADVAAASGSVAELEAISIVRCGNYIDSVGVPVSLKLPDYVRRCREANDRSGRALETRPKL